MNEIHSEHFIRPHNAHKFRVVAEFHHVIRRRRRGASKFIRRVLKRIDYLLLRFALEIFQNAGFVKHNSRERSGIFDLVELFVIRDKYARRILLRETLNRDAELLARLSSLGENPASLNRVIFDSRNCSYSLSLFSIFPPYLFPPDLQYVTPSRDRTASPLRPSHSRNPTRSTAGNRFQPSPATSAPVYFALPDLLPKAAWPRPLADKQRHVDRRDVPLAPA
ncbi:MAG: hypothetical protein IPM59_15445 [Chloracidobacterium sp.]|nr:hypothetical protein [Chloracidobacterium sp.]